MYLNAYFFTNCSIVWQISKAFLQKVKNKALLHIK